MDKQIVIQSIASASALGDSVTTALESLNSSTVSTKQVVLHDKNYPVFPLHPEAESSLQAFLKTNVKYRKLDRTAQLAMLVAEKCFNQTSTPDAEWVINAGSSRGATHLWEEFHKEFIEGNNVPVKSSPLTTLGNISSNISQHLKLRSFQIDHSITCSSGLQALANGYAWLLSGLADHFMAVGTEAPLTVFTIAQMAALGIYSQQANEYPCKPCWKNPEKKNTFALGEAAIAIALTQKKPYKGDIIIAGMGTASEVTPTPTSISLYGDAFRLSMEKAISKAAITKDEIDLIIPHSPGTYQGDKAEYNAIQGIFEKNTPWVFNHKYLTGHTLGASGLLSVELGYLLLQNNLRPEFPYPSLYQSAHKEKVASVLINSMGFGGNAVSILLKKI